MDSPFIRQIFVASSPQLAAFSVGGVTAFPNILLEQLKANDSSIQIDFEMSTWIGSTTGIAGIPSIAMPTIMQWKGRKFAHILSCLFVLTGWAFTYISKEIATIIIGESFHGLGINCIIATSMCTISEMVHPRYRAISLSFYIINHTLGMSICGIIGRYLHWKTVSILMSIPMIMAIIFSFTWPESPSWLAYKGEYSKCEESFKWLRGSDENSDAELRELLSAHKERSVSERKTKFMLNDMWLQITSRDFYVPCFHSCVVLCPFYFSGLLILVVYGTDVLQAVTQSAVATHYGNIAIYIFVYIGSLSTALYLKLFKNKTVFLASGLSSSAFMFGAAITILLQTTNILPSNSTIAVYFFVVFILFISSGVSTLSFAVPNELIPVKYRGLGGALYIIQICVLHTSVLKLSPYMMWHVGLWQTFLLFSLLTITSLLYIWKYVPETKGRTLQQIEEFYKHGHVVKKNNVDAECMNVCIENKI